MDRIGVLARPLRRVLGCLCLVLAIGGAAQAQQGGVLVVGNDRGGYVGLRAQEIDRLNAAGIRVEIRGNLCLSACTMYLGAGNLCIDPDTSFGFHGPSDGGRALSADRFDLFSRIMAHYYNEPVRLWFMSEARYHRTDYLTVQGAELIRLGYPAC